MKCTEETKEFREYIRCLFCLHKLIVQNKDESEEAESIREKGDFLWRELTEHEKEILRLISGYLNELSDLFIKNKKNE